MAKGGNTDSWWCEPITSWSAIKATRYEWNHRNEHLLTEITPTHIYCYISHGQAFMKGYQPQLRLVPTGGTIFTSEEKYMEILDQSCPFTSGK